MAVGHGAHTRFFRVTNMAVPEIVFHSFADPLTHSLTWLPSGCTPSSLAVSPFQSNGLSRTAALSEAVWKGEDGG